MIMWWLLWLYLPYNYKMIATGAISNLPSFIAAAGTAHVIEIRSDAAGGEILIKHPSIRAPRSTDNDWALAAGKNNMPNHAHGIAWLDLIDSGIWFTGLVYSCALSEEIESWNVINRSTGPEIPGETCFLSAWTKLRWHLGPPTGGRCIPRPPVTDRVCGDTPHRRDQSTGAWGFTCRCRISSHNFGFPSRSRAHSAEFQTSFDGSNGSGDHEKSLNTKGSTRSWIWHFRVW